MNSKTKDCAYCREGIIIDTLINIPNRSSQDDGHRYHCNNKKCGLKYRVDPNDRSIILIPSNWKNFKQIKKLQR